jgi:hypothetical protein
MAVVRVDLEVSDKGSAQVLNNVGGQLKMLGGEGIKAGAAIGTGFTIAQKAIEATIGILQSVGSAISGAVAGFIALGGHLADVAAKTAISTQALQKLAYAGSLVGVSEEEITGAAVKMERALANGDAVFGKLGLSIQKLRAMKPDEAFAAIATQIMKIKDPAGQAAAAMEAFGKSGATLLPLMKSDIAAATAEAERLGIVLSDKDVAAADALGDAGTKLSAAWEGVKNQFAASLVQNPAILAGMEGLVKMMGELSQWLIKNRGAIAALVDIMIGGAMSAVSAFKQLTDWVGQAGSKLKYFVDMVPGLRDALKVVKDLHNYLGMKNEEGSGLTSSSRLVQPAGGSISFAGGGKEAAAADKAQKAWQDAAEKARKEWDKFYADQEKNGRAVFYAMETDMDKTAKKLAANRVAEFLDQVKYKQMLLDLGKKNEAIFDEMEKVKTARRIANIVELGDAIRTFGDAMGSDFVSNIGQMVGLFGQWASEAARASTGIQKVAVALKGVAAAYAGGVQGKSPGAGALMGAASGAGAGFSMGGWWGAAVGAVVGGASGYAGGKKGQAQEIAALQKQFNELQKRAKLAGITIEDALHPKSATWLKSQIDDITKALDTTNEAHQKLSEAAERYGFTIDELGPKFAAQQLDPKMMQIYEDWQLLTAAGVDHEAMVARIGPEVGKLVDQYVSGGAEIPKAMKPIIDDLYTHGKLLHENGDAYSEAEYNGITYASTMSEMFKELITKVGELVDALNGVKPKDVVVNVRANDPDGLLHGGGGGGGGGDEGGGDDTQRDRGFASGLLVPSMSRDRSIRVHRGERVEVTPAANSKARNGSNGGGMTNVVNVTVQGDGDAQKIRDVVQRALDGRYIKVPA